MRERQWVSRWLMCYWFQSQNSLFVALSPLSLQEKMEIANIEPMQSIALSRKGLRATRSAKEQDWWEGGVGESWSMSGLICPAWHAAAWQLCSKLSVICSHSLFFMLYTLSAPLCCHVVACDPPTQDSPNTQCLLMCVCHGTMRSDTFKCKQQRDGGDPALSWTVSVFCCSIWAFDWLNLVSVRSWKAISHCHLTSPQVIGFDLSTSVTFPAHISLSKPHIQLQALIVRSVTI